MPASSRASNSGWAQRHCYLAVRPTAWAQPLCYLAGRPTAWAQPPLLSCRATHRLGAAATAILQGGGCSRHCYLAVGKFLDTEDGKNLLAGYKRATNIIRIEEKKDARQYVGKPDPSLYRQDEEWALSKAIDTAKEEAVSAVAKEDFAAAMRAMAKLRPHVDAFFDKVTVNVADGPDKEKLRENRLKLLNEIRDATRTVADFSRIEG